MRIQTAAERAARQADADLAQAKLNAELAGLKLLHTLAGGQATPADPVAEWNAAVTAAEATGKKRTEAIMHVRLTQPELLARYEQATARR